MGDSSSCLLHGFSYASAIPNEYKQGNRIHILGESISFGRFTSESLSYVEEAERYARPGSVAQKKAFFEAHYKRIAAQKAAAAAALAEAEAEAAAAADLDDSNSDAAMEKDKHSVHSDKEEGIAISVITANGDVSETSESTQMERPLLKNSAEDTEEEVTSKRRSSPPSSLRTSILQKTWRVPSTPAKQEPPPFNNVMQPSRVNKVMQPSRVEKTSSLRDLLQSKELDKPPVFPTQRLGQTFCRSQKNSSTPFKTPAPASTPLSRNSRMRTPTDSSATAKKVTAPRWHILSAVCPKSLSAYRNKLQSPTTVFTPFTLRTEERAARRKQKLEEKFNSSEAQKMQTPKTLKEKAGDEFRKLGCGLCFKARPLPEFYKERGTPNNHMKKEAAAAAQQPQTMVLGRSISNKKRGTVSMPPPPLPTHLPKNSSQKNVVLQDRITRENASPNIQQQ